MPQPCICTKYNKESQKPVSAELYSHTICIVHFRTQVRTDKVAWQPRSQIQSAISLGIFRKRKIFHQVLKPREQRQTKVGYPPAAPTAVLSALILKVTYLVGIISLKSSPGGQSFNFSTIGWPSSDLSRSARNKLRFLHVIYFHHSPLPCWSCKDFCTSYSKMGPGFVLGFQAIS